MTEMKFIVYWIIVLIGNWIYLMNFLFNHRTNRNWIYWAIILVGNWIYMLSELVKMSQIFYFLLLYIITYTNINI